VRWRDRRETVDSSSLIMVYTSWKLCFDPSPKSL
jgi:hypothetical protein